MKKIITLLFITFIGFSIPIKAYASECITFMEDDSLYTYENMREDIYVMTTVYPQLNYEIIGTSVDNRELFKLTLGNTSAENKILVETSIHGREYMNTQLVMTQLAYYLMNWDNEYKDGIKYKDIFENCCLVILPMTNPDGVTISQFGFKAINDEEIREKTKEYILTEDISRWKANANGVDLNRNFNCGWNNKEAMTYLNEAPAYAFFNGYEAESEPEIKAITETILNDNYNAIISYHSSGNQVFWYSGNEELNETIQELAYIAGDLTKYEVCVGNPVLRGLDYQWMTEVANIPTILIETGGYAAPLPEKCFDTIWEENKFVLSEICLYFNN